MNGYKESEDVKQCKKYINKQKVKELIRFYCVDGFLRRELLKEIDRMEVKEIEE